MPLHLSESEIVGRASLLPAFPSVVNDIMQTLDDDNATLGASLDRTEHLLGLEGREELPIWRVEEIVAEYHPGYSFVSKTFYPLTLLEIKFRGSELKSARITGEVEFVVHTADGRVKRGLLGKEYQVLNPDDLIGQLSAMTADRISKVVIYPDIKRAE